MEWIKCSEEMPKDKEVCLIYSEDAGGTYLAVYYDDGYGFEVAGNFMIYAEKVSHWIRIPEHPKED